MIGLQLVVLGIVVVILFVSILTLPRWCFGSVSRHRIWELRDSFVKEIVSGRIPASHPAVQALLRFWERRRLGSHPNTLVDVLLIDRLVFKRMPADELRHLDQMTPIDDLSIEQRQTIEDYRNQTAALVGAAMLASSWLGTLVILVSLVASAPRTISAAVERASKWRIGRRAAVGVRRSRHLTAA